MAQLSTSVILGMCALAMAGLAEGCAQSTPPPVQPTPVNAPVASQKPVTAMPAFQQAYMQRMQQSQGKPPAATGQ